MSVGEFWPEKGVLTSEWVLNYRQNAPVSNAGDSVSIDHGEPYWTANVSVEVRKRSFLAREWSAFFARRQGSRNSFTMNRTFQSFPADRTPIPATPLNVTLARRSDGRLSSDDQSHGDYRASVGDMVGYFTEAGGFYIGEIMNVDVSNAGALRTNVVPPPFPPHPTEANFRFVKAVGEFRLDGPPRATETHTRRRWRFTAEQVIRG